MEFWDVVDRSYRTRRPVRMSVENEEEEITNRALKLFVKMHK